MSCFEYDSFSLSLFSALSFLAVFWCLFYEEMLLDLWTRGLTFYTFYKLIQIDICLQEDGHRVRLATHSNFKEFVMGSGLEFFPLGGDPKVLAGCKCPSSV